MESILVNVKSTDGGPATATLVAQALRSRKTFVFGELLSLPQVQKLRNSAETAPMFKLLEIFAFGTYLDYVQTNGLPELNDVQIAKLRQLTVVSLAAKSKSLDYSQILRETGVNSVREAEDLVIACVYDDLLKARLDQRNQKVEVQWCAARDVQPATIDHMIAKLSAWCNSADDVLRRIDQAMEEASKQKQIRNDEKKLLNDEIEHMKFQVMKDSTDSILGKMESAIGGGGGGGPGKRQPQGGQSGGMMSSLFGRRS